MSNLSVFEFQSHTVRTVIDERGEPLFVGKDVCEVLGYADATSAMKRHCRGVAKRHPIVDSLGRTQEVRVLAEPDVMRLIVGSKLPQAEAFERLVFEEILPTIRKTGSYTTRPAIHDHPTLADLQKQARQSRGLTDNMETRVAALIGVQNATGIGRRD
jgi:prophage antirepressor-like protein